MVNVRKYLPVILIFILSSALTALEICTSEDISIFLPVVYLLIIVLFDGGVEKLCRPKVASFTILTYLVCFTLLIFLKIPSTKHIIGSATLLHILLF